MGGNALKNLKPVRLGRSEYACLAADCLAKLETLYPSARVEAIEAYREKPDFGDLDLLIAADGYDPFKAAEALEGLEVVRNGPVTSVGVQAEPGVFQVDLIKSSFEEFDYASRYFRWNDAGNLIGRIAHAGFTAHRHNGLYFYFRDGDHLFREILLTRDHDKALQYLGFDPERFNRGFDTLEDIFRFVASSRYFNRDIYLLQNRNAKARVRDGKRSTYMKFLAWCEARPDLPAFTFPKYKNRWLKLMADHFPEFRDRYASAVADLGRLRAVKAKYNGEWVSRITGLQGKALGELMRRFKDSFESVEAQQDFVLRSHPDEIEARIRDLTA